MGQFIKPEFAWLVPTRDGAVIHDDPAEAGAKPIIKVAADEVEAFKARFDIGGLVYVPLYSGVYHYNGPEIQTIRKKNERSK